MCVGARGLSGEKGWGDRAGGGQGKSQPGFALVFTTYWKCGPGNAAHVLCSVLSALVQTLQGPEESVLCLRAVASLQCSSSWSDGVLHLLLLVTLSGLHIHWLSVDL